MKTIARVLAVLAMATTLLSTLPEQALASSTRGVGLHCSAATDDSAQAKICLSVFYHTTRNPDDGGKIVLDEVDVQLSGSDGGLESGTCRSDNPAISYSGLRIISKSGANRWGPLSGCLTRNDTTVMYTSGFAATGDGTYYRSMAITVDYKLRKNHARDQDGSLTSNIDY